MFEEDLKVAKVTYNLVKAQLKADMEDGNIKPEDLPLIGKVVARCENDIKYYEKQVAEFKTEA